MELSLGVTLAVLGAALLHASWNTMIKGSSDKLLDTALVVAGGTASRFRSSRSSRFPLRPAGRISRRPS